MAMSRRGVLALVSGAIAVLVPRRAAGLAAAGLKFELYRDAGAKFRWRLKAGNGKPIASSGESYKNKADCRHAIELIMAEAATATIDDRSSS